MKRWIVNPKERTARLAGLLSDGDYESPVLIEFEYVAPTAADAMQAGARRLLAEQAIRHMLDGPAHFVAVADRIEPKTSDKSEADRVTTVLHQVLSRAGYDVWREGVSLLVLRGPR